MSTTLTPGQGAADAAPVGRVRRAASGSIGRLGGAPGVWLFIGALAVASAAVFVTLVLPMGPYVEDQFPWLFFVAAFALAEVGVLHFSVRSQAVTVSLAEFPLVIGFYFADPSALVLAQLVGSAVALVLVRRQTPARLAFNLALFSLSSSLAIVVFRAIAPPVLDTAVATWLAAFAATSVVVLVSAPAIAVVMSISLRQAQPGALRAGFAARAHRGGRQHVPCAPRGRVPAQEPRGAVAGPRPGAGGDAGLPRLRRPAGAGGTHRVPVRLCADPRPALRPRPTRSSRCCRSRASGSSAEVAEIVVGPGAGGRPAHPDVRRPGLGGRGRHPDRG